MSEWSVLGLDKHPVPGNANQVDWLGRHMQGQAKRIRDDIAVLNRIVTNKSSLAMRGRYAAKVDEAIGQLPEYLRRLADAYDRSGKALSTYALWQWRAWKKADKALRDGTDADRRYRASLNTIRGQLPPDEQGHLSVSDRPVFRLVSGVVGSQNDGVQARVRPALESARRANGDLEGAKRLANDATRMRETAEEKCVKRIEAALDDTGIKNRNWLSRAFDSKTWKTIVKVATVVAAVVGIIAAIIGSGGLAAIALIAGAVVLIDALARKARGQGSWGEVGLAVLGVIPGVGALGRAAGVLGRMSRFVRLGGQGAKLVGAGAKAAGAGAKGAGAGVKVGVRTGPRVLEVGGRRMLVGARAGGGGRAGALTSGVIDLGPAPTGMARLLERGAGAVRRTREFLGDAAQQAAGKVREYGARVRDWFLGRAGPDHPPTPVPEPPPPGRTVQGDPLDAVGARLEAPEAAGSRVGQALNAAFDPRLSSPGDLAASADGLANRLPLLGKVEETSTSIGQNVPGPSISAKEPAYAADSIVAAAVAGSILAHASAKGAVAAARSIAGAAANNYTRLDMLRLAAAEGALFGGQVTEDGQA